MKHTAGDWDPADRPIYFCTHNNGNVYHPRYVLIAVNDIMTSDAKLDALLNEGHPVLLDSGIFHLATDHARRHNMTMDAALALPPAQVDGFAKLRARYLDVTRRYGSRLWGYIELDQGGAAVKPITRAGLEDAGLAPIPVYHPLNDGWDYFDVLASSYDRICLGNIVKASPSARVAIMRAIWARHRACPSLWIHGLGYNPDPVMHAYPLDSCDSSDWMSGLRWGKAPVATADLAQVSSLPSPGAVYRLGDGQSWNHANIVGAFGVRETNANWRAHQAEAAALGGPLPPYLPGEARPCPSVSA